MCRNCPSGLASLFGDSKDCPQLQRRRRRDLSVVARICGLGSTPSWACEFVFPQRRKAASHAASTCGLVSSGTLSGGGAFAAGYTRTIRLQCHTVWVHHALSRTCVSRCASFPPRWPCKIAARLRSSMSPPSMSCCGFPMNTLFQLAA